MSDINKIRYAIRSLLYEEVQPQDIIVMAVFPGQKVEYDSVLKVVGFDRAMSRGTEGFGGTDQEELGGWKIVGLPERSVTGRAMPPPWTSFMDWLWQFLKEKEMEPMAHQGFGDTNTPYGKLSVHQKRQRKYGEGITGEGEKWREGYDVKRDVSIVINSLGKTQDEVAKKFDSLLKTTQIPSWFKIHSDIDNYRWMITVDIDVEVPEGYKDRLANVDAFKRENRQKWIEAIKQLAGGRTNPAQLAPIVRTFLMSKHGFPAPLNVDTLSPEDFGRAITTIKNTSLDDVIEFSKTTGGTPLSVSKEPAAKGMVKVKLLGRWNQIVNGLAEQGDVPPLVVQVALADYLVKAGFEEPFEPEIMAPAILSKAIVAAGKVTFDDLREFMESVQRSINNIMENK